MTKDKKVRIHMSLEEFKRKAYEDIRYYIKDEDYISKLDADMEKGYKNSVEASMLLGTNQVSPSGYAYGIFMLYPDFKRRKFKDSRI